MSVVIQLLLFLHVLAAMVWIGSFAAHMQLMAKARRDGAAAERARLHQWDDRLATTLYIPASLTVLVAGVLLVILEGVSFGEPWISFGLAVWIFAFLLGILYYVPRGKKISEAIERHGEDSPEVQAMIDGTINVQRLDIGLLVLVVFAMTTKLTF
jgi:uncharacterized membrane protein